MPRKRQQITLDHVDGILIADIHLRDDQPVCRMDDFVEAMVTSLDWLSALQVEHGCPVYVAGDLFHKWKASPFLLSLAFMHLPDRLVLIPGQHDLPQHAIELFDKSGIGVLVAADPDRFLCHRVPVGEPCRLDDRITMQHTLAWKGTPPYPGAPETGKARSLLVAVDTPLLLTGDNHQPFTYEEDGKLLVNPGSMMRTTADQKDHRPRVYLWDAEANEVAPVYLPDDGDVVSREHVERAAERDGRVSAFVERLSKEEEYEIDFEENLRREMETNDPGEGVKQLVWEAVGT